MKNKISSSIVIMIVAFFVISFLFGCGAKNDKEIVINLDEIKDISTEKFTDLKIADNKGDTIYFGRIADIILGNDSDIIIVDSKKSRLVQLDKNGNFKKYVGRQGFGPGEFNFPEKGVYYNDNYYIRDNNGQLIQKYDKDMNYLTSYKTNSNDIAFINESEIVSIYEESDKYIFCTRDTLGNIIRSFGDIEGNEEGLIKNKMRIEVKCVYDSIYKHIFLVSVGAPIIRRFDLNGNLLQRINIEGAIIDSVRAKEKQPPGIVQIVDKDGNLVTPDLSRVTYFRTYLASASSAEGHRLIIFIQNFGAIVLHYNDNDIIDQKIIKCEIETEDKSVIPSALKDFNNIMLLYEGFYGKLFISKN